MMKKILYFVFLLANIILGQNYVTVSYEKPSAQNFNDSYGFNRDVALNGFSIAYHYGFINSKELLLKTGFKFSYSGGKFYQDSQFSGYHFLDSHINIYNYSLDALLSYNVYKLKPFLGIGLGVDNYSRSVNYSPDAVTLQPFLALNKSSSSAVCFIGVSYSCADFLSASAQYGWYRFFDYKSDYSLGVSSWGRGIPTSRENLSIGLSYIF